MRKFWNWTQNATERVLRIDGAIDYTGDTTPKEFKEELNSASGSILLLINSPGGNIFASAEIYSMLKDYSGGKITARIPAYAASAATIIAMAADIVEVSPLAILCIHNPYLDWTSGEEKDLRQAADYLAEVKESVISAYELKTKLPRQQISEMMDAETYMNAKKAVELHFADKIIYTDGEEDLLQAESYSSRQAVTSMLQKFNVHLKVERGKRDKIAVSLYQRLNLGGIF